MVSVCVTGPAFSCLLYENAKAEHQQEGFLLGEVVHKESVVITDSDQRQVKISKIIKIHSVIACPHAHYFYNGAGKVDEVKVREFLGDLFDKVVAWYRFEHDSDFKLMMREKIVHKQLATIFKGPPDLFLYCMLINDISHKGSTHAFTQTFLRKSSCAYENVPLHIPNLSESNNCYISPEPCSETFTRILRDQKIDMDKSHNAVAINQILCALCEHTDSVIDDVVRTERNIHKLEMEIRTLEAEKRLKLEQQANSMAEANVEQGGGDSLPEKSDDRFIDTNPQDRQKEKILQNKEMSKDCQQKEVSKDVQHNEVSKDDRDKEVSKEEEEPHETPGSVVEEEKQIIDSQDHIEPVLRTSPRAKGRGNKQKANATTSTKRTRNNPKATDLKN